MSDELEKAVREIAEGLSPFPSESDCEVKELLCVRYDVYQSDANGPYAKLERTYYSVFDTDKEALVRLSLRFIEAHMTVKCTVSKINYLWDVRCPNTVKE